MSMEKVIKLSSLKLPIVISLSAPSVGFARTESAARILLSELIKGCGGKTKKTGSGLTLKHSFHFPSSKDGVRSNIKTFISFPLCRPHRSANRHVMYVKIDRDFCHGIGTRLVGSHHCRIAITRLLGVFCQTQGEDAFMRNR